ncbi:hypothetical protein QYM36_000245 [Artemia franciscana]|uniref:Protein kinase domain-containing protein n=2 Tax=Artemia franciscana TaxID=6661 RepID=A0AA88IC94_ARTSF|nr:hypothetical protein QYM36_000245 [Artemia franciscana]
MSDRRNNRFGPFRRRRRLRLAPTFGPPELNRNEEAEPPQPVPVPAIENSDKPQLISDRYILLENVEGTKLRKALDIITKKEYSCSVLNRQIGATVLEAHFRLQSSEFVAQPTEIITAGSEEFIFYPKNHGDIHAYVRDHLIRDEDQAQMIIRQIVGAVADCHSAGIVLTDLKMRRFVFANAKK